jgi:hypothetical protein
MNRGPKDIFNQYANATEYNLATLSGLLLKKSSAKSEVSRQTNICTEMLAVCWEHKANIVFGNGWSHHYGRVEEVVKAAEANGGNLATALAEWASKITP